LKLERRFESRDATLVKLPRTPQHSACEPQDEISAALEGLQLLHHHHCERFPDWPSAVAFVGFVLVEGVMLPGFPPARVSSGLLGSQPRRTWGLCQPVAALDEGSVGEVAWMLKIGCCLSAESECFRLLQQHSVSTLVVKIHCRSSSQSPLFLDSLSPLKALLPSRCCFECSLSVRADSLLKCCLMLGW